MIGHFLYKMGRVGRELFEFEELWLFLAEAIRFLPPKFFNPTRGKSKPLWSKFDLWNETHVHSLDSKWGTWRNLRLWKLSTGLDNFSPDKSLKKKKKVIAVQPISLHVQTFHGWHGVIFIFWFFDPIDERRRLFSDGKFGVNDSTSRFLIFVWAVLYDTFLICVIIVTPVTTECFRNQCESFRNVKAQLDDPAVS